MELATSTSEEWISCVLWPLSHPLISFPKLMDLWWQGWVLRLYSHGDLEVVLLSTCCGTLGQLTPCASDS